MLGIGYIIIARLPHRLTDLMASRLAASCMRDGTVQSGLSQTNFGVLGGNRMVLWNSSRLKWLPSRLSSNARTRLFHLTSTLVCVKTWSFSVFQSLVSSLLLSLATQWPLTDLMFTPLLTLVSLLSTFPLVLSHRRWSSQRLVTRDFPYGSQPVRGVNLGGWLVLEVRRLFLPVFRIISLLIPLPPSPSRG